MFRRESAVEYFKDLVDGAMEHQRLQATACAAYYVVQMLAAFAERPGAEACGDDTPLAIQLAHALESAGSQQRVGLKQVGDASLFISGFFSDSLRRKLVDVDYYATIGGYAYQALSRVESDAVASIFAELAEKFVGFVDVLAEVSERSQCASNADLLRLYERWLKTGSRRSGQLLVERGVVPNTTIRGTPVQ
jgi:hypothetical protein